MKQIKFNLNYIFTIFFFYKSIRSILLSCIFCLPTANLAYAYWTWTNASCRSVVVRENSARLTCRLQHRKYKNLQFTNYNNFLTYSALPRKEKMAASVQIWRSSYTLFYSYFEIESICFDFFLNWYSLQYSLFVYPCHNFSRKCL